MPELPEVESIRRSLLVHVLGRVVTGAALLRRDVLVAPGDPVGRGSRRGADGQARPHAIRPADLLVGATITDVRRCGKQLALVAADADRAVGVQLGMTGHLGVVGRVDGQSGRPRMERHVHATWAFDSGATLCFEDPRRFGLLRVFRSLGVLKEHWAALGPDALTITSDDLGRALQKTRRPIKAALLDQRLLAGVGNIYADESLFLARVNPQIPADRLSPKHAARLAEAIRRVLAQAVEAGGSTLRDYADADGRPGSYQQRHAVYGRAGLVCSACPSRLSTGLVGQRTTVWCPRCQPARLGG